jgi:hypothetical protein
VGWRGTAAVGVALAVGLPGLGGCTSSAAEPRAAGAAATRPAPAASPVVVKDCWVPTSTGNVSLLGDEAKVLTARAAELGRGPRADGERVAARLVPAVLATSAGADRAAAAEVAAGLAGVRPASRLVCSWPRGAVEPQEPGPSGLVPRARRLRATWTEAFGPLIAGGFARGGVSSGHVDGSAHYEGRAVDVFFRPLGDAEQHRRGWVFAQWLVAHAADHHVLSVIYDDRIWTSWAAGSGWRDYVHPGATFAHRGNSVLRHKDHVHVAVESGRP